MRGVEVDPRYRFRTSTILDWLAVTEEEQRSMQTFSGQRNVSGDARRIRRCVGAVEAL